MDTKEKTLHAEIKRVANKLGVKSLTCKEFLKNTSLNRGSVYRHGKNWTVAVTAAGLTPTVVAEVIANKKRAPRKKLLAALMRLEFNEIKVTQQSISEHTEFSYKPFKNAFGDISTAITLAKAAYTRGELEDLLQGDPDKPIRPPAMINELNRVLGYTKANVSRVGKKALVGEQIDFRGMRFGPTNESGVVCLFGMVSEELGFKIEVVQVRFPDCIAKRRIVEKGQERWQELAIEFEYMSSNFSDHGHDPSLCDMIVCWQHDWKDVPDSIDVLELSTSIKYLSASGRP